MSPISYYRRVLLVLSCVASLLTLVLTIISAKLPPFDASHHVLLPPVSARKSSLQHIFAAAVLRWDAFHFAHVAKDGYTYEHEWAFFSGTPLMLRLVGHIVRTFAFSECSDLGWDDLLLGGFVASIVSTISVLALYDLTLLHLGSPDVAFLASLLSLLPSSPVTLRLAGYSEPFFTLLSYLGMLSCAQSRWLFASCCFALAGVFRSNGIFLCGFILWGLIVEPILTRPQICIRRVLYAFILSGLTLLPFIYHQYTAYRQFCVQSLTPARWCAASPPLIYTYIQATYWNSGFMLYWTIQQLPNFLLGAPPLLLLFTFAFHYTRHALLPRLTSLSLSSAPKRKGFPETPFLHPSLAPHVIHALVMCMLLLFASHTQIVLRLAASMPLTYWAAAWLLVERPKLGGYWVGWSVVWGAVSCVLWGVFLPPA